MLSFALKCPQQFFRIPTFQGGKTSTHIWGNEFKYIKIGVISIFGKKAKLVYKFNAILSYIGKVVVRIRAHHSIEATHINLCTKIKMGEFFDSPSFVYRPFQYSLPKYSKRVHIILVEHFETYCTYTVC